MELCKKKVIDKDYHLWYEKRPVAADVVDTIPLPNVGESTDIED